MQSLIQLCPTKFRQIQSLNPARSLAQRCSEIKSTKSSVEKPHFTTLFYKITLLAPQEISYHKKKGLHHTFGGAATNLVSTAELKIQLYNDRTDPTSLFQPFFRDSAGCAAPHYPKSAFGYTRTRRRRRYTKRDTSKRMDGG